MSACDINPVLTVSARLYVCIRLHQLIFFRFVAHSLAATAAAMILFHFFSVVFTNDDLEEGFFEKQYKKKDAEIA